jgi:hypothetical protein
MFNESVVLAACLEDSGERSRETGDSWKAAVWRYLFVLVSFELPSSGYRALPGSKDDAAWGSAELRHKPFTLPLPFHQVQALEWGLLCVEFLYCRFTAAFGDRPVPACCRFLRAEYAVCLPFSNSHTFSPGSTGRGLFFRLAFVAKHSAAGWMY